MRESKGFRLTSVNNTLKLHEIWNNFGIFANNFCKGV